MDAPLAAKLFALLLGMVMVHFIVMARVLVVLRKRHPEIYQAIPRPILVAEGNNEDNSRATAFLWQFTLERRYLALRDTELAILCRSLVALFVIFTFTFVAAVFVGLSSTK